MTPKGWMRWLSLAQPFDVVFQVRNRILDLANSRLGAGFQSRLSIRGFQFRLFTFTAFHRLLRS